MGSRKGKTLLEKDFDKMQDLLAHNYTVAEVANWVGWSKKTVNHVAMVDTYDQYRARFVTKKALPEQVGMYEYPINAIDIQALIIALTTLEQELVSNTKATWALRRDLLDSHERLINALTGTPIAVQDRIEEQNA